MSEVPKELYFYDDWLAQHTKRKLLCGNNRYLHEDHVDALIAAAYDAAARAAFRAGKSVHSGYRDENERIAQRIENELRLEVQAAIRGSRKQGPQEALDALLKAERVKALRDAENACERVRIQKANGPMPEGACFDYEQTISALIEKETGHE